MPDAILDKPGPLSDEEWTFIRQHTVIGERILGARARPGARRTARARQPRALRRHGYPDGLAGEEIPLGARIISVCDAFDAMTSPRPYTAYAAECGRSARRAPRGAGSQFDPLVVQAFATALDASGTDRDLTTST